jgi:hypothetical protein
MRNCASGKFEIPGSMLRIARNDEAKITADPRITPNPLCCPTGKSSMI